MGDFFYRIAIPEEELPKGKGTHKAITKGARAWKEGLPRLQNPYHHQEATHEAWYKGWDLAEKGVIEVIPTG